MKIDHNCWYQKDEKFANFKTGNYRRDEFTRYQKETGLDANSIMADPCFVNMSENNYQLDKNFPCINKGNPNFPFVANDKNVDIGALR